MNKNNKIKCVLLINFLLLGCTHVPEHKDPVPTHDSFQIESSRVGETRIINVWTPPGYAESTGSYPVLYMPDGGIKEDFPHIANTIAKLIQTKSIPPIILAGIENTKRRRDLTGPSMVAEDQKIAPLTDGADKFRAFIKDELFAEMNRRYRITDERGIVGESVAGLFVVETFFKSPDMFDFYIAMDPSLYWNNTYLVRTAEQKLAEFPEKKLRLWFAGSNAIDIFPHTRKLAEILEAEAPKSLIWTYSDEPDEQHSTIFRATKERAFTWTLKKRTP